MLSYLISMALSHFVQGKEHTNLAYLLLQEMTHPQFHQKGWYA
jgi:hypothetical protein